MPDTCPTWEVRQDDCVEAMRSMPEASVDAVICDPPYGLEFMGKEWDRFRVDDPGTARHRHERAGKHGALKTKHDSIPAAGRVTYGGGKRPTTHRCAGCGKRDQFQNPHEPCGAGDWRRELIDPHAAPPTMLAFQGWVRTWALEAKRVLKPGGHLLAFGGTRTYHRLACAIEDAGFEIRDCLVYMYGSGFPKSLDVSKAIDKAAPATPEAAEWQGWGTTLKPAHEPIVLARKPLTVTVAANVLEHGTGALNVDGCRIDVAEGDEPSAGHRTATFGPQETQSGGDASGGWEAPGTGRWPANVLLDEHWEPILRLRDTLESDAWQLLSEWCGARNGEVPSMRSRNRRPAEPGEAPEVLLEGVSGQMDEGERQGRGASDEGTQASAGIVGEDAPSEAGDGPARTGEPELAGVIPESGLSLPERPQRRQGEARASSGDGEGARPAADQRGVGASHQRGQDGQPPREPGGSHEGRAHAAPRRPLPRAASATRPRREVLLRSVPADWLRFFEPTGDVASVGAGAMLDEQSGESRSLGGGDGNAMSIYGTDTSATRGNGQVGFGDTGGASRFFYCAKASRGERNAGLEGFEERTQDGGDDTRGRPLPINRNVHPTVKPIALMRWLCRLVTPPGGTVLDPFAGSGSTGCAAVLEGFDFIGIEREAEYVEIARARIAHWACDVDSFPLAGEAA